MPIYYLNIMDWWSVGLIGRNVNNISMVHAITDAQFVALRIKSNEPPNDTYKVRYLFKFSNSARVCNEKTEAAATNPQFFTASSAFQNRQNARISPTPAIGYSESNFSLLPTFRVPHGTALPLGALQGSGTEFWNHIYAGENETPAAQLPSGHLNDVGQIWITDALSLKQIGSPPGSEAIVLERISSGLAGQILRNTVGAPKVGFIQFIPTDNYLMATYLAPTYFNPTNFVLTPTSNAIILLFHLDSQLAFGRTLTPTEIPQFNPTFWLVSHTFPPPP